MKYGIDVALKMEISLNKIFNATLAVKSLFIPNFTVLHAITGTYFLVGIGQEAIIYALYKYEVCTI